MLNGVASRLKHLIATGAQAAHEHRQPPRSAQWPHVEHAHLSAHPTCAACGGNELLNVHHKRPFHLSPALELEPTNLLTLCMAQDKHCHLVLGHGGNFRAFNPCVELDAASALACHQRGDTAGLLQLAATAKARRRSVL